VAEPPLAAPADPVAGKEARVEPAPDGRLADAEELGRFRCVEQGPIIALCAILLTNRVGKDVYNSVK
jgi:hypothetical protein